VITFLRSMVLAAGLLAWLPAYAQIGGTLRAAVITEARGTVAGQTGKGKPLVLKKGHPVQPGMVIDSAQNSDTVLAFPDGQVGVLGSKGTIRLNNYSYDISDSSKSDINLSLVTGNLRVVMGEIGQSNPGALHLQVGTASVAMQSSDKTIPADASLVSLEGAIAVNVQVGRLEVRLPDGTVLQVLAGQTLMLSQDGKPQIDTTAKMIQVLGESVLGREIQAQLAESQSFNQDIAQAQAAMAAVNAALKDPAAVSNPEAKQILALLENLPPPEQAASQQPVPEFNTTNTPASGAAGGGTPCTASCN
jgi:hypothetical protein